MSENRFAELGNSKEHILNLALGYQVSQVLFAAINLNIFTTIAKGITEIAELSKAVESDEQSLARLLNSLVSLKLLEKTDGRYSNTEGASRYLVKGRNNYLGNAIHHSSNLWGFWEGLDEQVKSGGGKEPDEDTIKNYSHRLQDYLAAMNDFAAIKADVIADSIMIKDHKKMLDLGSGPGTYAIAFTKKNPKLQCTIVDLDPNLVYTRRLVRKSKCSDRIFISACNILEDKIPGYGYDLILISNLIHIYAKEEVKKIIEKAWDATVNHGKIVLHDYIVNEKGISPLIASLFDLTMLVGTPHGKCYNSLEIKGLLGQLGAKKIRLLPVCLGSSLVIGERLK